MTICIAALCDDGKSLVVAADRMVSASFLTIEFDHPDAKIDRIGNRCVALSSGAVLAITDVLSEESGGISGQLQNPAVRLIANEITQRFIQVRYRLLNEQIFKPRGLSFDDYYTHVIRSLPHDLAIMLDQNVQSFSLDASLIVAGVDISGGHIYEVRDPGTSRCYDRIGYHAIGSGSSHAILSLVAHQHNKKTGVARSLFNVYCAKRHAEIAPGVGLGTDMLWVTPEGIVRIDRETLEVLSEEFAKQGSPQPDLTAIEAVTTLASHEDTDDEHGDEQQREPQQPR